MQVRYVGEREVPERMSTEHLRTEERVIEETVTSPCSPLECNGCVPTNRGVAGNGVSILHANANVVNCLGLPCAAQRLSSLMFWSVQRMSDPCTADHLVFPADLVLELLSVETSSRIAAVYSNMCAM